MRVLIFHGYLLRGTGSNVYNANLAQALARLGHEVHLICQDRRAELDWVRRALVALPAHVQAVLVRQVLAQSPNAFARFFGG